MSARRYLLDTDVVSDLVRHPQGNVTRRIARVGEAAVATSVVVAAELRYGAAKRSSERLSKQLELVLGAIQVIPLEPPVDAFYAAIRNALEKRGKPLGANDLWIAAQARALDRTLVTGNVREFERVPELRVENWLSGRTR